MGSSLKMQCPHCEKARNQGIEPGTNDPKLYYSDPLTTLIGKKLLWREQTRRCTNCGKTFEHIQISSRNFWLIINELLFWANEIKYFKAQYESAKQKIKDLQHEVASLKQSSNDWEDKYKKLENYVKAAPVEHDFSSQDETYVENEEKNNENLWG